MLKKINDKLHMCIYKDMIFSLVPDYVGKYMTGWCMQLFMYKGGVQINIATFVTKDDNVHSHCYMDAYGKKIWELSEILPEADEMIMKIIHSRYQ